MDSLDNADDLLDGAAFTTSLIMFFGGSIVAARFAHWFKTKYDHPATVVELGHHFASASMAVLKGIGLDPPELGDFDAEAVARQIEVMMLTHGLQSDVAIEDATVRPDASSLFGNDEVVH